MHLETLLGAIGSQEESSFSEICQALGDERPAKGDKAEWRDFFDLLRKAENQGLIEQFKNSVGNFEGAILTEAGVAHLNPPTPIRRIA